MRVVLASGSARRLALLRDGGVEPTVVPAAVDETPRPDESPVALVRRLAVAKASAVPGDVVIGSDTEVVRDGVVLGKPADVDDARAMLRANAGRVLTVWSGVAVATPGGVRSRVVGSFVRFAPLSAADVEDYLATGEPMGVAGAFRIQGAGARLLTGHAGCWTSIVGLPRCQTSRLLAPHGVRLAGDDCQSAAS